MGESMFSKKKSNTWSSSAPTQISMFKERRWSPRQDTTNEPEPQLQGLQAIQAKRARQPSILERLAESPQPASPANTENIQCQENEEEELQPKLLEGIQRQETEEENYTPLSANLSTVDGTQVKVSSESQILESSQNIDVGEITIYSNETEKLNYTPADANLSTSEGTEVRVGIPSNASETEQLITSVNDVAEMTIEASPTLNQQALLEQASHVLAYKLDPNDPEDVKKHAFARQVLINAGYNVDASQPVEGKRDFAMRSFTPFEPESGLAPIVAFRGTDTKHELLHEDLADLDGVGKSQYIANRNLINQEMQKAYNYNNGKSENQVIVTGHSLGGALAQQAAIDNPNMVSDIITFQSARITNEDATKLDQINADRVNEGLPPIASTHHRVEGDIVPTSGENMTRGNIYTYEMNKTNAQKAGLYAGTVGGGILGYKAVATYQGHLSYPLTTRAVQQGEGKTINGYDLYSSPNKATFNNPSISSTEQDKGGIAEYLRRGVVGVPLSPFSPPEEDIRKIMGDAL